MTFEDELLSEFLIESYESLDQLDQDFVRLESDLSRENLAGIFRAVHTIKGSSGFLGLQRLEGLAHVGENLLAKLVLRVGLLVLLVEGRHFGLDLVACLFMLPPVICLALL